METLEFSNPYLRAVNHRDDGKRIVLRHGHIAITDYNMGDNPEFEKLLSVWDKMYWRYNQVTGYYIPQAREFRIGRGFNLRRLMSIFPEHRIEVDNWSYHVDKVEYNLTTPPKNDFQTVALTFMAGEGAYYKNKRYTQQLIDADTGDGKTYCGVAISAYFKSKVVVVVPISKLLEQWKESYLKFTTLEESQIMIVKGSAKCDKIRNGKCEDKVIYIFTADTIMSYINNRGIQACIEMLEKTGAYMKIIDEIHKDMGTVSAIEAMSNFKLNLYMSASPMRTDQKENYIFQLLYQDVPKFGSNFKQKSEKHINIMVKKYTFFPDDQQIRSMYRPNLGLNTKAYERVLISAPDKQRSSFDKAMLTMLRWSKDMVKKNNKILILCQTVDGTKFIEALAEKVFPGECAHYYATGMTTKQKADALEKKVICATSSSMGTGADIKNLQHVINICTYSNPIDASQLPGRARKLKDGTPVVYIELVNMGYRKTVNQYNARSKYLRDKAAKGKIMMID